MCTVLLHQGDKCFTQCVQYSSNMYTVCTENSDVRFSFLYIVETTFIPLQSKFNRKYPIGVFQYHIGVFLRRTSIGGGLIYWWYMYIEIAFRYLFVFTVGKRLKSHTSTLKHSKLCICYCLYEIMCRYTLSGRQLGYKLCLMQIINGHTVCLLVLLLYVPSQQLWTWWDGQFTKPHFFLGKLEHAVNQYFVHILLLVTGNNPS